MAFQFLLVLDALAVELVDEAVDRGVIKPCMALGRFLKGLDEYAQAYVSLERAYRTSKNPAQFEVLMGEADWERVPEPGRRLNYGSVPPAMPLPDPETVLGAEPSRAPPAPGPANLPDDRDLRRPRC